MTGDLIVFWLAAVALMGSPGPATLSLAALGAAFGPRAGLRYLAGIVAGTVGVLLLIATGVTGVVLAIPVLKSAITTLAAGYILYLAWMIATAAPLSESRTGTGAASFPAGFMLAIANPKAFAAIGAVYSGATLFPDALLVDAVLKCIALLVVIVVVNIVWLVFGSIVSSRLRDPRSGRIANVIFAGLLVASVAATVL